MDCWMRVLKVKFTSETLKKSIIFGENYLKGDDDVEMEIEGTKYLSAVKDTFTINLYNLTYNEMSQLINGKYYKVEIICGYRNSNTMTVFKGSVIYISNDKFKFNTNRCIVLCGNNFISNFGQNRMNLSLNAGLNLYDAIKFILRRQGLTNVKIDESLKNRVIKEVESMKESPQSWIENFCDTNGLIINVDSTSGTDVTILSAYKTNNRLITLTSDNLILTNGYPKISSDGLTITCLPTFNFQPGDVIQLDNSIINTSTTEISGSEFMKNIWIDIDGRYMIYEVNYTLNNMDGEFSCSLKAKARSLYNSIPGYQGATSE